MSTEPARRRASARLSGLVSGDIGCGRASLGLRGIETTFRPGTKGREAFRGATLVRRCAALASDGPTWKPADRRRRGIAGALRRSLLVVRGRCGRPAFGPGAPGSIRRRPRSGSHRPPDLWPRGPRVLVPIVARSSVVGPKDRERPPGCQGRRAAGRIVRSPAVPSFVTVTTVTRSTERMTPRERRTGRSWRRDEGPSCEPPHSSPRPHRQRRADRHSSTSVERRSVVNLRDRAIHGRPPAGRR